MPVNLDKNKVLALLKMVTLNIVVSFPMLIHTLLVLNPISCVIIIHSFRDDKSARTVLYVSRLVCKRSIIEADRNCLRSWFFKWESKDIVLFDAVHLCFCAALTHLIKGLGWFQLIVGVDFVTVKLVVVHELTIVDVYVVCLEILVAHPELAVIFITPFADPLGLICPTITLVRPVSFPLKCAPGVSQHNQVDWLSIFVKDLCDTQNTVALEVDNPFVLVFHIIPCWVGCTYHNVLFLNSSLDHIENIVNVCFIVKRWGT